MKEKIAQCSKRKNISQIMGPLGFEPMDCSRRDKTGAYDHSSTTVVCEYEE